MIIIGGEKILKFFQVYMRWCNALPLLIHQQTFIEHLLYARHYLRDGARVVDKKDNVSAFMVLRIYLVEKACEFSIL